MPICPHFLPTALILQIAVFSLSAVAETTPEVVTWGFPVESPHLLVGDRGKEFTIYFTVLPGLTPCEIC